MKPRLKNKFEQKAFDSLRRRKYVDQVTYETERLSYTLAHTYTPDFIITLSNGYKFYIETKGRFTGKDRTKLLSVKEQHPDVDLRLVFQENRPLFKGSKTRNMDWAKKWGFPAAIGSAPREWFKIPK